MKSKQSTPSIISYRPSEEARTGYEAFLQRIIETRGIRTVCDIGGGANPALPLAYIRQHNLEYTVLDISESELQKAPPEYHKIAASSLRTHFYGVLPIFRGLSFDVGSVDIQHFKNGRRNGFTQDAVSFGVEMAPWVDVELFRAPGKYQCLVRKVHTLLP